MKRNRFSTRETHNKKGRNKGVSRYKAKLNSGKMMYGPGCCAHKRIVRPRFIDAPPVEQMRGYYNTFDALVSN